jgi:hypothetical protein
VSRLSPRQRAHRDKFVPGRGGAGYRFQEGTLEERKAWLKERFAGSALELGKEGDVIRPGARTSARALLRSATFRREGATAGMSGCVIDEHGRVWAGDLVARGDGVALRVWGTDLLLLGRYFRLGGHSYSTRHYCWREQHQGRPVLTVQT